MSFKLKKGVKDEEEVETYPPGDEDEKYEVETTTVVYPVTSIITSITTSKPILLASVTTIATSTTTTSSTTTATITTPGLKYCGNKFPVPINANMSAIKYDLIQSPIDSNKFKPSSYINFTCKTGFFNYDPSMSLKTVCSIDGTWTSVAKCEPHPCWNNLPKRPLNGKREVVLVLNSVTGMTRVI
jgi:hypothetical protein